MVKLSRQRSAEVRIELLDAAAEELCRVGYDAMAFTSVAGKCGFATSAIYNRFPTKEALVEALVVERLEPTVGAQCDAAAQMFWAPTSSASKVDAVQLGVLAELLLAARHTPALQDSVYGFVRRRAEVALAIREQAVQRGEVREGQDPLVQVLTRAASWIGGYLFGLVSAPPKHGSNVINEIIRVAVTNSPLSTALPSGPASKPRTAGKLPKFDEYEHDKISSALVEAAADLFAEFGYEAASVADISRRAGLTTGAIYNRFTGKAGLMNEVILTQIGMSPQATGVELVEAFKQTADKSKASFDVIIERFGDDAEPRRRALRLAARDAARQDPEVAAIMGPLQDNALVEMANVVRSAQQEGLLRSDVDAEALVWWISVNPLGISLLRGAYPELEIRQWAPTYTTIMEILRTAPV